MVSPNKILITGGSGFLGSHVVDVLDKKGYSINILARPDSYIDKTIENISYYHHDGSQAGIAQAVIECSPDVIINTAGLHKEISSLDDSEMVMHANCTYPSQIMAVAAKTNCQYFITIGSYWQFDSSGNYKPMNLYAASKQACHTILDYYHQSNQFKTLNLILYDTYGPNDNRGKLMNLIKNSLKDNISLPLSDGYQPINLIHIQDAANAVAFGLECLISEEIPSGATYCIKGDETLSIRELVKKVSDLTGKHVDAVFGKVKTQNKAKIWEGKSLPNFRGAQSLSDGLINFFKDV